MAARARSYRCAVCRWQGTAEPFDFGDTAPCPNCGVYLYPLSWMQTWGIAILMIVASLGVVAAAAVFLR